MRSRFHFLMNCILPMSCLLPTSCLLVCFALVGCVMPTTSDGSSGIPIDGGTPIGSVADELDLELTESTPTRASLRRGADRIFVVADPNGQVFLNSEAVGPRGGITSVGGGLLLPDRTVSALEAALKAAARSRSSSESRARTLAGRNWNGNGGRRSPASRTGRLAKNARTSPTGWTSGAGSRSSGGGSWSPDTGSWSPAASRWSGGAAPRLPRRRIVVDAGHGGKDPGATSVLGYPEKRVNLHVALEVARLLKTRGLEVILTRGDDRYISLERRAAAANQRRADLFVSIHADACPKPSVRGFTLYTCKKPSSAAQRLAGTIETRLSQTGFSNRGIRKADFKVLVNTRCPAVLVELGYLTNRQDAALLARSDVLSALAHAVADGVCDHVLREAPTL